MGKYFKYAVGEILLVVIGILIALQINNWNEGRKMDLKAKNYIATIANDLVLDTIGIDSLINRTKPYKKNINGYFNYVDSLKPSNQNLKKLYDKISKIDIKYMKYYPVNNSYQQMETTDNGNLLSKVQRDFLLDLLSEQEELGIIIDSQLQIAINNNDKSKELFGFPNNIYEKLNKPNPSEKQIQGLIHYNIYMHAVERLYFYTAIRGEKIKKMIRDNIYLFTSNT